MCLSFLIMIMSDIAPDRKDELINEFRKPYFEKLVRWLHQQRKAGQTIYPT
jgi:uracil DNA glycosylase